MTWEDQEVYPLEEAGYEQKQILRNIIAQDAGSEQIVYSTEKDIVTIGQSDDGIQKNRLSIQVDGEIEDVATGQTSAIYLIIDGALRVLSANGSVSDALEDNVVQVEAPTEEKIVVFVDETGQIHGLEAQNRLPKFRDIEFTGVDEDRLVPTIVAGRKEFIAYGGSTVRSYDERGNVKWEAQFDAEITGIGQLQGDCIVGLADDSIRWVNADGESTMVIGGTLESIAAIGHRMVIGSADGSLTAFGDNGLAPDIAEASAEQVVQTGDDHLVGLFHGSDMYLFCRRDPQVRVETFNSSLEGQGGLVAEIENPYPVPLQLQIRAHTINAGEPVLQEVFLQPRTTQSETVELANISEDEEIRISVESGDGTISAFDEMVTIGDAESNHEFVIENVKSLETDWVGPQTEDESGESQEEKEEKSTGEDPTDETSIESGAVETHDKEASEESSSEDRSDRDSKSETSARSDSTDTEVDASAVQISLDLVELSHSLMTWQLTIGNDTDQDITAVNIEETKPAKFTVDGKNSMDIVQKGETFTVTGSFHYRTGPVSAVVSWEDSTGGIHQRSVEEEVPEEIFQVSADRYSKGNREDKILEKIEFTLINQLEAPILDSVTISAIGGTQTESLGEHNITLNPGKNLLTKHLSPEEYLGGGPVQSYEINLKHLQLSDTVDAALTPQDSAQKDSERQFFRDIGVWQEEAGSQKISSIEPERLDSRPTHILIERIKRKNETNSWAPAETLWAKDGGEWSATDEILPSLQSEEAVEVFRCLQNVNENTTTEIDLPAYRLGEKGSEIIAQTCKSVDPKTTLYSGIIPTGPNGEYILLLCVKNNRSFPIELEDFKLKDFESEERIPVRDRDTYRISAQSTKTIYFKLADSFDSEMFSGLAYANMKTQNKRHICSAIVKEHDDPPLDNSKIWFGAECDYSTEDQKRTLTLTISNESQQRMEDVTIQLDGGRLGVIKPVLNEGESIAMRRRVNSDVPERWQLEDGSVYKISAMVNDEQITHHVRVRPVRTAQEPEFEVSVLPNKANIDEEKLIETWPSVVATNWRYNIYRSSTPDQ